MISCLNKMYPKEKSLQKSKSWGISIQNALYADAMNIIKNKANSASETGCRLIITGDIVQNSPGLSKFFDIYISIFKNLAYIYEGQELFHYTELVFEQIVQANFTNYGSFINSPQNFIKNHFNENDNKINIQNKHNSSETNTSETDKTDCNVKAKDYAEKEIAIAEESTPHEEVTSHEDEETDNYSPKSEVSQEEINIHKDNSLEEKTFSSEKSIENENPLEDLKSPLNDVNDENFFFVSDMS